MLVIFCGKSLIFCGKDNKNALIDKEIFNEKPLLLSKHHKRQGLSEKICFFCPKVLVRIIYDLLSLDWLVFWNESLHQCPSDEICNCTIAEDNHIAGRLAFNTEECECTALTFSICEEHTRTLIDEE